MLSIIFYKIAAFLCRPNRVRQYVDEVCTMLPSRGGYGRGDLRVCAASVDIHECKSLLDFVTYIYRYVREGALNGAKIICLPEYTGLLALPILPFFGGRMQVLKEALAGDGKLGRLVHRVIEGMTPAIKSAWLITCSELARRCRVYIVAGSALLVEEGRLVNRAALFDDQGRLVGHQDKLHASLFEAACDLHCGEDISVFATPFGKIAIGIGTDAQYYEPWRIAVNKGAELLFCPSAADDEMTYHMEARGFESRVQENRVYGVKSVLSGSLLTVRLSGRAAVYGPPELTKYQDGILAVGLGQNMATATVPVDLDRAAKLDESAQGSNDAFIASLRGIYEAYFAGAPPVQEAQEAPDYDAQMNWVGELPAQAEEPAQGEAAQPDAAPAPAGEDGEE